jgi:hypothetical protein
MVIISNLPDRAPHRDDMRISRANYTPIIIITIVIIIQYIQ